MVKCQNNTDLNVDQPEDVSFKCMDRHEDECQQ